MTSVNITNDLKKILRDKFNIKNITASKLKEGFTNTNDYYKYLYELYNKEKEKELDELRQKEKIEIELKEKLDKLKQKNKLKKLKYKLNKKKKLNDVQDNILENIDDNSSIINKGFHSENDLNDAKNDVKCNDTDNDENNNDLNDKDNDSTDEPCNESTDDSSSDENEYKYIETYNDTSIEVKNIYFYK
jgi:hypothetical protein